LQYWSFWVIVVAYFDIFQIINDFGKPLNIGLVTWFTIKDAQSLVPSNDDHYKNILKSQNKASIREVWIGSQMIFIWLYRLQMHLPSTIPI
jgi:hypothetical protein